MNRKVFLITTAVTLYIFGLVYGYFTLLYMYYVVAEGGIILFINASLIYGVYSIHKTI